MTQTVGGGRLGIQNVGGGRLGVKKCRRWKMGKQCGMWELYIYIYIYIYIQFSTGVPRG